MRSKAGRPKHKRITVHLTNGEAQRMYEGSVRIIKGQSPSYLFSACGNKIYRDYYLKHGLGRLEADLLLLFTFHRYFLQKDLPLWGFYVKTGMMVVKRLVSYGLITKIKAPLVKNSLSKLVMLVPTLTGQKFIDGYKEYYDARINQIFDSSIADSAKPTIKEFMSVKIKSDKKFDKEVWKTRILKKKTTINPNQEANG